MRTPGGEAVRGCWGRSLTGGSLSVAFPVGFVAVLGCCTVLGLVVSVQLDAAGEELDWVSPGFISVRAIGPVTCVSFGGLAERPVNCDPDCNPAPELWQAGK